MLTLVLQTTGWLLAHAPEGLLRPGAAVLGEILWWVEPRRRRLVLSNLDHAFPARPAAWRRQLGRACSRRLVETGMLSLATPHLSERRIRAIASLAPSVDAWARDRAAHPRPVVFGTVHLALWESQTWLQLLSPAPLPEFGIIYRPLDNAGADAYVKRTRERFGMRLLSRKGGFAQALHILRGAGCVGVLFDQNAGNQGALTLLFARVCSSTELPGLLTAKFGAELRTFYPRRLGFWRVAFESDPVAHDGTAAGATLALNRWLETALAGDANLCASWLWAHDRWRHQDVPERRLRLESKRNLLAEDLRARQAAEAAAGSLPSSLPKRLRLVVRLPNWLGDVVMVLPLVRALRASRPDAEIILLARPQFRLLIASWGITTEIWELPPQGVAYLPHFLRLRRRYPDVWLLFTHSVRGDLEAWLRGRPAALRGGPDRPAPAPADRGLPASRQISRKAAIISWSCGRIACVILAWKARMDRSPPRRGRRPARPGPRRGHRPHPRFGKQSRETLAGRPLAKIDRVAAGRMLHDFRHGQRSADGRRRRRRFSRGPRAEYRRPNRFALFLPETAALPAAGDQRYRRHASREFLGVPLVALFGPTNPVRTGPVFAAPALILQPPDCAATGGGHLADLLPETVVAAVRKMHIAS